MRLAEPTTRVAASAGGQVLRAATTILTVRSAAKPLHPCGRQSSGTLRRYGGPSETGVDWLDTAGQDRVLVRTSRAIGLPAPAPDIFGIAVRVPRPDGRSGDLLFATTGLGRLTRFVLTATSSPRRRPMTTLLPYRTPAGPLLLSAAFEDDSTLALAWAVRTGAWHRFSELSIDEEQPDADGVGPSFDPVRNTVRGLENYSWVQRLREPSYLTARRSRRS
jgi:hypothetical protein